MKEKKLPLAQVILQDMLRDMPLDFNLTPGAIVKTYWGIYDSPKSRFKRNNSLDGAFFKELIILVLKMQDIAPVYIEAKVAFIPPHTYDVIFYEQDKGPIVWSLKTSLRERWKQADGEGYIVQVIHRKAESHLVTLHHDEVRRRRDKPSDLMGIDDFILADTNELDKAINFLKNSQLVYSPTVQVVSSNRIITEGRSSLLKSALTEYPEVAMVLS